jgi:adenylyltransferase/sulfurtransferase
LLLIRDILKYRFTIVECMVEDDEWRERYLRQTVLAPIGEEGQRRLGGTTVAVVGAGALGSNSAELLVRMGFGHVRLIDRDVLELSNLHRTDNMSTRYVVNDACLELGVPWVYGGVVATGGLVAPLLPEGPCLRCLFPHPPEPGSLPTCESAGIHPSVPAVVASVQVAMASRLALDELDGPRLLALDIWSDEWRVIEIGARPDCPACAGGAREFLTGGPGETVTSLCGQDAVQIDPGQHAHVDMEAKAREWEKVGQVTRRGPMLVLDLGEVRIQLFPTGRALVKGTAEVAVAKSLYARYVGH